MASVAALILMVRTKPLASVIRMKSIFLIVSLVPAFAAIAGEYTLTPDGSYVSGDSYTLTPDGSYVSGDT